MVRRAGKKRSDHGEAGPIRSGKHEDLGTSGHMCGVRGDLESRIMEELRRSRSKAKEKQLVFIPNAFHIVKHEPLTCSSLGKRLIAV